MSSAFDAVADPTRRQILDVLRAGPQPVQRIVDHVGCSQPSVSKHLRVLREAGLVDVQPDAQRRVYALRPHALQDIDNWLAPYRALWSDRLHALGQHLDTKEKK